MLNHLVKPKATPFLYWILTLILTHATSVAEPLELPVAEPLGELPVAEPLGELPVADVLSVVHGLFPVTEHFVLAFRRPVGVRRMPKHLVAPKALVSPQRIRAMGTHVTLERHVLQVHGVETELCALAVRPALGLRRLQKQLVEPKATPFLTVPLSDAY